MPTSNNKQGAFHCGEPLCCFSEELGIERAETTETTEKKMIPDFVVVPFVPFVPFVSKKYY